MTTPLLLATLLSVGPHASPPWTCGPGESSADRFEGAAARGPVSGRADDSLAPRSDEQYRALWNEGLSFADFLATADRRKELWESNWEKSAEIDARMFERAAAAGGAWRVLVIAVDGCSDSASTIPFIARVVAEADNLEMRIVDSAAGARVMAAHPTPDGRSATPTVLLLDGDFESAGCFIERPIWLRDHIVENPGGLDRDGIFDMKMAWYAENEGRDTVAEFVEIVEAAGAGGRICASDDRG